MQSAIPATLRSDPMADCERVMAASEGASLGTVDLTTWDKKAKLGTRAGRGGEMDRAVHTVLLCKLHQGLYSFLGLSHMEILKRF